MTPRPELPREFVAEHKRRRMMDAMAALCAERGYGATKIADIVSRAGVARKTLYDNFGGKEELFLESFEATAAAAHAAVVRACEAEEPEGGARVEAGLAALLAYVGANPAPARMCVVEAVSASSAAAARYEEMMHGFVVLLRGAAPAAPSLPETIPEALVGGVAWIVQQRLRHDRAIEIEALLPELSQFVLSPYRGVGKPGD